eukprot:403357923
MNTFLTEYEHGHLNDSTALKRVNFKQYYNKQQNGDEFTSPYVDFYIKNLDKMGQELDNKMNKFLQKKQKRNNYSKSQSKQSSRLSQSQHLGRRFMLHTGNQSRVSAIVNNKENLNSLNQTMMMTTDDLNNTYFSLNDTQLTNDSNKLSQNKTFDETQQFQRTSTIKSRHSNNIVSQSFDRKSMVYSAELQAREMRRLLLERANKIKNKQMKEYREQLTNKYTSIVNSNIEVIEKIPSTIANSLIKDNFIKMRKNLVSRTIQAEMLKRKFSDWSHKTLMDQVQKERRSATSGANTSVGVRTRESTTLPRLSFLIGSRGTNIEQLEQFEIKQDLLNGSSNIPHNQKRKPSIRLVDSLESALGNRIIIKELNANKVTNKVRFDTHRSKQMDFSSNIDKTQNTQENQQNII